MYSYRPSYSFAFFIYRIGRDVTSVFSRGGGILTDFLGGAKYEEKTVLCAKTQKNHYFSNSEWGQMPPAPLPTNDVPAYRVTLAYGPTVLGSKQINFP